MIGSLHKAESKTGWVVHGLHLSYPLHPEEVSALTDADEGRAISFYLVEVDEQIRFEDGTWDRSYQSIAYAKIVDYSLEKEKSQPQISWEAIEKEIRTAYIAGQRNSEMMEAGLERDEVDDHVNWVMMKLKKDFYI